MPKSPYFWPFRLKKFIFLCNNPNISITFAASIEMYKKEVFILIQKFKN